ncbi:type IV pilus assembly protein FimV [Pseudomonas chlororaphis subsp. piscium]
MFQSLLAALRGFVGSSRVAKSPSLFLLPVLATLYSSLASAVGLGEITVHSALNQPLEAEIALVQAQGLEEGELAVSLATAGEFKQAGVERLPFLEDLRFTPILQGDRRVIRVVSSKPVNEPFLDFLLQVNQANGRQLREYTLLIDPPGSPEIVPAPVAKPEPTLATQAPPAAAKAVDPVAGQLAQALQANQQLQSQAQELQNTLQQRDEQLARQQQQLVELQRQLAEVRSKPADNPALVSAPATPTAVSPPPPAEQAPETEGSNPWLMLAALLLTALLVLLVMRRRRQSAAVAEVQIPSESRPTRTLASAVTMVAAQEPFRSTPPVAPVQAPPVAGERLADREPSIDADWDLIAPSEPSSAPPSPVAAPTPFNADSIVWRLEEPGEPGSSTKAEAESDAQPQNVWPKLR